MKSMYRIIFTGLCLFSFLSFTAIGQVGVVDKEAETKPALMILGTYHMAKTTKNVFNFEVTDVLSEERQKQIAELMEKLAKYHPTKIMVEADVEKQEIIQERYEKYLKGEYQLTRNETDQICFRLAKMLGHQKIYCIDWGKNPGGLEINYITYSEKHEELKTFLDGRMKKMEVKFENERKTLATMNVIDQLIYMNNPEKMNDDHRDYFEIMRIGKGDEYIGARYLAWWYGRNLRILMNIIRNIDSPDDRVLVVYGAGHGKLLNQQAEESGFFSLESPLKYLKGQKRD